MRRQWSLQFGRLGWLQGVEDWCLLPCRATRQARQETAGQELALGIHRSDYMLDAPSGGFLQVGPRSWGSKGAI